MLNSVVSPHGPIRVVLAEDHPMYRDALEKACDADPDITLVAMVSDGEALIEAFREHRPDLVVTDVRMTVIDGIEATKQIVTLDPSARVLVMTGHEDRTLVVNALSSGATGFVFKQEMPDAATWQSAIRRAAAGETVLSSSAAEATRAEILRPTRGVELSDREQGVLTLARDGLKNKEIASQLNIGEATVKSHLESVYRKLGVHSRLGAVQKAIDLGLIPRK